MRIRRIQQTAFLSSRLNRHAARGSAGQMIDTRIVRERQAMSREHD
jgi:hypothetical protein